MRQAGSYALSLVAGGGGGRSEKKRAAGPLNEEESRCLICPTCLLCEALPGPRGSIGPRGEPGSPRKRRRGGPAFPNANVTMAHVAASPSRQRKSMPRPTKGTKRRDLGAWIASPVRARPRPREGLGCAGHPRMEPSEASGLRWGQFVFPGTGSYTGFIRYKERSVHGNLEPGGEPYG